MLLTQNNYHGACHCRCQRQLGRHRLEVQDDRFCCCCGCRMASDFHCQALQEGDGIRACSQADGITGFTDIISTPSALLHMIIFFNRNPAHLSGLEDAEADFFFFPLQVSAAGCKTCKGKGAVECPGCKVHTPTIMGMLPLIFLSTSLTLHKTELADVMQGTGKNKKNGNIFERWK